MAPAEFRGPPDWIRRAMPARDFVTVHGHSKFSPSPSVEGICGFRGASPSSHTSPKRWTRSSPHQCNLRRPNPRIGHGLSRDHI